MSHSGGKCWINRWTVAVLAAEKLENRKESDLWPGDVHHSWHSGGDGVVAWTLRLRAGLSITWTHTQIIASVPVGWFLSDLRGNTAGNQTVVLSALPLPGKPHSSCVLSLPLWLNNQIDFLKSPDCSLHINKKHSHKMLLKWLTSPLTGQTSASQAEM